MISPIVATAIPLSSAAGKPCSSAMVGPQAIAVPCPPTSDTEPDDHAGRLRHAERHRADGADQVLQEHEGDRDEAEHAEDAAARRQIREPRVHPDRREEDDEQPVPRRHVEADVDAEDARAPPRSARAATKPPVTGSGML